MIRETIPPKSPPNPENKIKATVISYCNIFCSLTCALTNGIHEVWNLLGQSVASLTADPGV